MHSARTTRILSTAAPQPPHSRPKTAPQLHYNRFETAGGRPLVVSDPTCATSAAFMELGAVVVREVAKQQVGSSVGFMNDQRVRECPAW